ncbi:MAG: hypothetical protein ACYCWN_05535 [Ferrimicrobium sp.]|uniref:hypothetical protein n=1 Tax=Ferrimicrobium acidiphilum TaxID=121039 RepID=UPI0034DD5FC2
MKANEPCWLIEVVDDSTMTSDPREADRIISARARTTPLIGINSGDDAALTKRCAGMIPLMSSS